MNVAVVTSLYPSAERPHEGIFAERRLKALEARGHRVSVVHPVPLAPPGVGGARGEYRRMLAEERRGTIRVRRPRYLHVPEGLWPPAARANPRRFARAARAALAGEPTDVVLLDYAWPAAEFALSSSLPCVLSGRGSDVLAVAEDQRIAPRLAAALKGCAAYGAVSRDLLVVMDRLAGRPGAGVLLENGVDTARFRPGSKEAARAALGLSPGGPLVGVVGHLIPRKDPLLALEAFERGAPSEAELVFAGRGELREPLEQAIAERGLAERVRCIGEVEPEKLAELYRAIDVLLLTSHREGRPNVVLEAFASGTPAVATPAGGTPELFEHVPTGLAPGFEAAPIAEELKRTLAEPPDPGLLRAQVSGRSWEACAAKLEGLLSAARKGAHA